MLLLLLTLLFVLGAGAGSSESIDHRSGDKVVLPCHSVDSSETSCSIINWLYNRDIYTVDTIVRDGEIVKDSPQAAKLSLGRRCSLTITNISSEDAGIYICRFGKTTVHDTHVYLTILTPRSSESIHRYHRAGDDVTLSCNSVDSSETSCPRIDWLYNRDIYSTHTIVSDGEIKKDSPQPVKLSLGRRCSLTITNISSEDAGLYICRFGKTTEHDTYVYLNILTPDQIIHPGGGVTLTCTLRRYTNSQCGEGSLQWLDEARAKLKQEHDEGYQLSRQKNCVSDLTITHQSDHTRRFTCQFVENNEVKTSVDYTLVSTAPVDETSDFNPNKIIFILNIAKICLLTILVVVGLTVFIKSKRRTGAAEDAPERARVPDESETNSELHQPIQQASLMDGEGSGVTYVAVTYRNRNQDALPSSEVREPEEEEEEEVTYATVKK